MKIALPMLTAGLLVCPAAFAADSPPEGQLTIRAERPTAKVVGRTDMGVPVESYQLTYHVRYADLDPGTPAGVEALKARVYKAADALCKDLDKLYPLAETDPTCVRKATDSAASQVNTVVKLAQNTDKTHKK